MWVRCSGPRRWSVSGWRSAHHGSSSELAPEPWTHCPRARDHAPQSRTSRPAFYTQYHRELTAHGHRTMLLDLVLHVLCFIHNTNSVNSLPTGTGPRSSISYFTSCVLYTTSAPWRNSGRLSHGLQYIWTRNRLDFKPSRSICWCHLFNNSSRNPNPSWLRGPAVEHWSLAGVLSLSCARLAADGWPLMWVSHPL